MVERSKANREPSGDRVKSVPIPATGTSTVVIGCKVPNGIIMREFKMVERTIKIHGMVSTEELAQETGKRFTVRGPALAFGQIPNIPIAGGFALTPGVPADLARTWFKQNADSDIVQNQLIFMESTVERAQARAVELSSIKSGLESLDPANLPREFTKGKTRIETADLTDR